MSIEHTLRVKALDRHRIRLFGPDAVLKAWKMTPADGETLAATFTEGWRGQRTAPTTGDGARSNDISQWQFEVAVPADWENAQAFWKSVTALTIGDARWRISKAEEPVGVSLVWKVKANRE